MAVRKITIGDHVISDESDAYVIAEIGHNHEGELGKARKLVELAAAAGASAAKLQKRDNKSLFTASMYNEPYTGRNSYGPTYGAHREALEFGRDEYIELAKVAKDVGIDFLSTAFDFVSVDFLADLDVPAIKMASADLTNTPLLAYAAKTGKPLIISTGGANMEDVRRAVDTILPINPELAVLQCTAVYPAGPADLHLSVIETFRREFPEVVVGFSGHDGGPELSMVAYTLCARVVEKHFTLDRSRPGSDHHFSLEPDQLGRLVDGLREARKSLGRPEKRQMPSEAGALRKMGKKLVAARDLPAGQVLSERDIAIKSPGDGLRPYMIEELVGRTLTEPLAADTDFALDIVA